MHDALACVPGPVPALRRTGSVFHPQLAERQDDFLWMMNYADALHQNQEPDKSWRLRWHLLSSEWAQAQQGRPMTRTQARAHWLTEEGWTPPAAWPAHACC